MVTPDERFTPTSRYEHGANNIYSIQLQIGLQPGPSLAFGSLKPASHLTNKSVPTNITVDAGISRALSGPLRSLGRSWHSSTKASMSLTVCSGSHSEIFFCLDD